MAQIVKLKRTAVSGKIPTISNLQLGELAMNTYDGRIFFEKSSSEESIQEILTTNSHPYSITFSLYLNGAITASFFKGDGSQLTNLPSSIGIDEATTVTASYSDSDDITITHNFTTYNVLVSVYDNNRNVLIPATTSLPTTNTARVTLSGTQSGFVVVAKGGHLISGSQIADNANKLNNQAGSYYLNWNNFNNVPAGIVSGSSQLTSTFDTRYLNTNGDSVISSSAQLTSTFDSRYINTSGDGVISGSSQVTLSSVSGYNANEHFTQGNITTVGTVTSGNVNAILPRGVISGSVQVTDHTTHKETVSGATSYVVDHNLDENYPIVQCWNTSTNQQELPTSVTTNSANRVTVVFSINFGGVIIVKK